MMEQIGLDFKNINNMANITITIPTGVLTRVLNALSTNWGYTGFLSDGITPEIKQDFVKRKLIEYIKREVKAQEGVTLRTAFDSNVNTNNTDIDNNISIT